MNHLNAMQLDAAKAGRRLPDRIIIDEDAWAEKDFNIQETTAATVRVEDGTIWINPKHRYWTYDDIARNEYLQNQAGYRNISTNHKFHILRHELSHLEHRVVVGPEVYARARTRHFTTAELEVIGKHVSELAQHNGVEFVAEVRCGLLVGKKYPPVIMKLYDGLHGPR